MKVPALRRGNVGSGSGVGCALDASMKVPARRRGNPNARTDKVPLNKRPQ